MAIGKGNPWGYDSGYFTQNHRLGGWAKDLDPSWGYIGEGKYPNLEHAWTPQSTGVGYGFRDENVLWSMKDEGGLPWKTHWRSLPKHMLDNPKGGRWPNLSDQEGNWATTGRFAVKDNAYGTNWRTSNRMWEMLDWGAYDADPDYIKAAAHMGIKGSYAKNRSYEDIAKASKYILDPSSYKPPAPPTPPPTPSIEPQPLNVSGAGVPGLPQTQAAPDWTQSQAYKDLSAQIAALQGQYTASQGNWNKLQSGYQGQIGTLQGQLGTLQGQLGTSHQTISDLQNAAALAAQRQRVHASWLSGALGTGSSGIKHAMLMRPSETSTWSPFTGFGRGGLRFSSLNI